MKQYITVLIAVVIMMTSFTTVATAECNVAFTNEADGKVSLIANMCTSMLVPYQDNKGIIHEGYVEAFRQGERIKLKASEVDLDEWNVEYTYLLSPDTPVEIARLKEHAFGAIFDPREWDPEANAMTGNLQTRSPDGKTVVFLNLGAVRPTEDGAPCSNCVVAKPANMGGSGKELAMTFIRRGKKS